MAAPLPPLPLQLDFAPETGRPVTVAEGVVRVSAPNATPYTFTGTNSFLVGDKRLAVLDPGPDDAAHLAALLGADVAAWLAAGLREPAQAPRSLRVRRPRA